MGRRLKKRYRLNRLENFPAGYQEGFTRPCKDRHSRSSHWLILGIKIAICRHDLGSRSLTMRWNQTKDLCVETVQENSILAMILLATGSERIKFNYRNIFVQYEKNSQKILEEKFWTWTWICLEDPLSLMHRFKVENGKVTYQSKYLQSGMWMWFLTLRPSPNLEWLLKNFN